MGIEFRYDPSIGLESEEGYPLSINMKQMNTEFRG